LLGIQHQPNCNKDEQDLDRRLLLEFLPGLVFLTVNAVSTLYVATAAAILAAIVAVFLRYRIDGQLPFLAISTVLLSVVMLGAGLVQDDERFIKIKPTIGGVSFALILAAGMLARPSMLQRSMGYKLEMIPTGWTVLHFAWIGLALTLAGANELVWRNTSTDLWVTYNVASGPVTFGIYFAITYAVAWWYWDEDEDEEETA
jgi:intracellular septation protein